MSDFQLTVPELGSSLRRTNGLSLGDFSLRLSPENQRIAEDLRAARISPALRRAWFNPDWYALDRNASNAPMAGGQCSWSAPGSGPATPRAGTVGDVMSAIYKTPCVREYLDARLTVLERFGTSIWDNASTGGRVGMGTAAVIVVGSGVVAGIILGPLNGKDIPIPFLPGVSARVSHGQAAIPSTHRHLPSEGAISFQINFGGSF